MAKRHSIYWLTFSIIAIVIGAVIVYVLTVAEVTDINSVLRAIENERGMRRKHELAVKLNRRIDDNDLVRYFSQREVKDMPTGEWLLAIASYRSGERRLEPLILEMAGSYDCNTGQSSDQARHAVAALAKFGIDVCNNTEEE